MRRLTYYVACTIDGFIAGPAGQYDFFSLDPDLMAAIYAEMPETIPTAHRPRVGLADAANQRFDTVVMGRGTYEPARQAGIASPYAHLRQYVFSRDLTVSDPAVEVVNDDPVGVIRELKQQDGLGIWLCGGGVLAGQLLPEIDELVVKRYPLAIGSGTPMFQGRFEPTNFVANGVRTFATGAAVESYRRP